MTLSVQDALTQTLACLLPTAKRCQCGLRIFDCARARLVLQLPHSYVGELSQEAAVAFGNSVPSSLVTGPAVIYVWQGMFGRWLSSK